MANLNLSLIFKLVDQVTAPVRRVGKVVEGLQRPFRAARMAAGGLLNDLKGIVLAGAAVGAVLGAALYRSTRRYADVGDAALETSQKLGVSVPAFMRWSHAAKQGGVEAASLEDALKFLGLSSSAAADGAKQDQVAFARLGITYRNARGQLLPLEQLLPQVADRFAAMEDGPRKSAIAVALFGRSGLAMIPMLNEGAAGLKKWGDEADRLGIVMSQRGAEQADEFNDSLNTLNQSIFGLGNGIAGGLLPQLTALIKSLTRMIAANKPEILRRMQAIFAQISDALPGIIKGLSDFARFLGAIASVVGSVIAALGGLNNVLDLLVVLMVGRLAVGIWSAVAAVWGLNGAMLANPVGLVIVAIAALVLVVIGLVRYWKPVTAFFAGVWAGVLAGVSPVIGLLARMFLNFTPAGLIIKHWKPITAFFAGVWAGVVARVSPLIGLLVRMFLNFTPAGLIIKHWKPITAFFAGVWAGVVAGVSPLIGLLARMFLNFTPQGLIIKHWASIVSFFQGLWSRIGDAFKVGIDAVWNILPPWFRQVLRGASFVIRAVSGIGGPASGTGGGTGGAPRRPQPAVGAAARATVNGRLDIRTFHDGRAPEVFAQSSTPGFTFAPTGGVTTRGGG